MLYATVHREPCTLRKTQKWLARIHESSQFNEGMACFLIFEEGGINLDSCDRPEVHVPKSIVFSCKAERRTRLAKLQPATQPHTFPTLPPAKSDGRFVVLDRLKIGLNPTTSVNLLKISRSAPEGKR